MKKYTVQAIDQNGHVAVWTLKGVSSVQDAKITAKDNIQSLLSRTNKKLTWASLNEVSNNNIDKIWRLERLGPNEYVWLQVM